MVAELGPAEDVAASADVAALAVEAMPGGGAGGGGGGAGGELSGAGRGLMGAGWLMEA